ncbi:hypothetical protein [Gorillibacterium timonense]|uniref:hypothetical protein n=1 Tax=Gorillibacterium timonense TaxID=1689269 RepID=UPI00071C7E86|nr:hypothetical protein [Gorillibacterium timonense]
MNKTYAIKLPTSVYIQFACLFLLIAIQLPNLLFWLRNSRPVAPIVISLAVILSLAAVASVQFFMFLRKNDRLEITENFIRISPMEAPLADIERIIVHGYFFQSIGIKRRGKRFVSFYFHFRFEDNEDEHVKEFLQWAGRNGIEVTHGRIIRWI